MQMLLNGAWVDRPERLEVRDPQDAEVIDTVPHASAADRDQAIEAAVMGAAIARALPTHQRMPVLRQAAESVQSQHETLARTIARGDQNDPRGTQGGGALHRHLAPER